MGQPRACSVIVGPAFADQRGHRAIDGSLDLQPDPACSDAVDPAPDPARSDADGKAHRAADPSADADGPAYRHGCSADDAAHPRSDLSTDAAADGRGRGSAASPAHDAACSRPDARAREGERSAALPVGRWAASGPEQDR